MRTLIFKNLLRTPVTEAPAGARTTRHSRNSLPTSTAPHGAGSAAALQSARSMRDLATVASWKFMRSTTRSTISNGSGLRFVASPRHADVLMVTGPVTKNMREALERTYNATPNPKWVVAVGDCAASGGVFSGSYAVIGAVKDVVPVDLHIRGCPPRPVRSAQRPACPARTK